MPNEACKLKVEEAEVRRKLFTEIILNGVEAIEHTKIIHNILYKTYKLHCDEQPRQVFP